jgi:caa(3)-type oxidase subunit IV
MHTAATIHDDSKGQYFWVWGVLLLLTAAEVVLAYKQVFQPLQMLEALMILSIIKSALIIGYFMHLKYEAAAMKWVMMSAVVACLCLMCIFFPDAFRVVRLGVR